MNRRPFSVKVATEPWEFEQIHALNHRTFVQEIPRYQSAESDRLVDRFHDENTYIIGIEGDRRVAAMIAVRDRRPLSLDERLPNLESYLPPARKMCELRLLAVERRDRLGRLLPALFNKLWEHCRDRQYDLALISGITKQLHLYRHVGFEPFGPLIGTADAQFQPMMLTLERFTPLVDHLFRRFAPERSSSGAQVNFLPGPVTVAADVKKAFERPATSHRSLAFVDEVRRLRARLCELVSASSVELLLGSGTLANDVIAAQLSLQPGSGLVLSNGEFGDRLIDHARRFQLRHAIVARPWGEPLLADDLDGHLTAGTRVSWVWFVHCETSTGVLNDLDGLRRRCADAGVTLCVDAISSVGTLPVNLRGVSLASGVSGKGLCGYSGLAMVFHDREVSPAPDRLPRYLDLGLYASHDSIPFTQSSNLIRALDAALLETNWTARFTQIAEHGAWLRSRLREMGFRVVAPDAQASPAVVTIALPADLPATLVGDALEQRGYVTSVRSPYLIARNWLQICLMGEVTRQAVEQVTHALVDVCGTRPAAVGTLRS